ncbi:transposase [Gluconobacter sp. R75690]|uniref:IS66 family insertion sequence element accessory protein TnpA n=1 Tax=unclassified Gluconobacter TaxID=2644261 RepID=UPI00188D1C27|nr:MULTISPECIES: transposase [unclassified Gluconobacter]MBF0851656.1 transposase [Gluconobacter sp. R75690]MBF0880718.1 transposase [Gluconobacter sp. R75828]
MINREEVWRDRLVLFAESGLTQTAFCSRHGLSAKALRLWARRLGFVWPPPIKASIPDGTSGERAKEFSGSSRADLAIPVGDLKSLLAVRVRKTWTPEESLALLIDARQSGMSLDRYAKMNGLTSSVLYRWQKQFADQIAECPADPLARQPKFASVKIEEIPSTPQTRASPLVSKDRQNPKAHIEIVLRNGRILRVTPPIDFDVMTRLADALEAAA